MISAVKMSEMGFENVFYLENFECSGAEVLVESSPPASPARDMATARRAQITAHLSQESGGTVRDLIVIPELPASMQIHTLQQVQTSVVETVTHNGDSSNPSSPTAEAQHTFITVQTSLGEAGQLRVARATLAEMEVPRYRHYYPTCEGSNGVNYHVQYVEPQEMYNQSHQTQMDGLRSYPVYTVPSTAPEGSADWGGGNTAEYASYGVVVAGDEAASPLSPAAAPPPRMPPATVQWLLAHYETADGVSLPRSTLYAHYLRHCAAHRLEPVNAASFGKLIRSVFVGLRTRRLGTRGNSKYHYYGIRAKANAGASPPRDSNSTEDKTDDDTPEAAGRSGEASPVALGSSTAHRQYLGSGTAPEPPDLAVDDLPDHIPVAALQALRRHHKQHGVEFLEAVAALDTSAVERSRRAFWRRPPPDLCRRTLLALTSRKDVADWLRQAELELYQRAVELLLPDVLRPIPPQLTQSIRNFAKSLETALSAGGGGPSGAPPLAVKAQSRSAAALAAALRRYTSLNHLAQAARAVLTNHHQIQQMLSDLNRVDFRVVREQAAWACSCANAARAQALEHDFKATLGRGASLEQWALWLERCVARALQPHERERERERNSGRPCPRYTARARRLLLDWSFYSSLVIRELTLRSAASFGSFHLIRLLYDEYVSYLVERHVAAHLGVPPIAVMLSDTEQDDLEEDPESAVNESIETVVNESVSETNGAAGGEMEGEGETEGDEGADPDDPDWEWADEDDDDDETECKRARLGD